MGAKRQKNNPKREKNNQKKTKLLSNNIIATAVGLFSCIAGFYIVYFSNPHQNKVVTIEDIGGSYNITCSEDYKEHPIFTECTPIKTCGRFVRDNIVSDEEVEQLLALAKRGFAHGGSDGGASILDLHSGALSMGERFVNIYKFLENDALLETFRDEDFELYNDVKSRVHKTISEEFGIDPSKLYLTHPTFFSSITNTSAKTQHDEYWHKHIDKIQYGSFDYTSLLYLTSYKKDFEGGRFIFDDANSVIIEPKRGRLSFFTSGSENPHHVEKVTSGVRYAITISFTCDPKKSIKDPKIRT
ncbi:2-oxoglutarate and iron-dependent oxygenase domain-containing protein 3-like [Styela clava]